jgi:hypothetical protein
MTRLAPIPDPPKNTSDWNPPAGYVRHHTGRVHVFQLNKRALGDSYRTGEQLMLQASCAFSVQVSLEYALANSVAPGTEVDLACCRCCF